MNANMSPLSKQILRNLWLGGFTLQEIVEKLEETPGNKKMTLVEQTIIANFLRLLDRQLIRLPSYPTH